MKIVQVTLREIMQPRMENCPVKIQKLFKAPVHGYNKYLKQSSWKLDANTIHIKIFIKGFMLSMQPCKLRAAVEPDFFLFLKKPLNILYKLFLFFFEVFPTYVCTCLQSSFYFYFLLVASNDQSLIITGSALSVNS